MRVNLIHSKLVFQKKKLLFTFTWTARVKSIHCTGFFFIKKNTLFTVMNSAEKKSMDTLCKKQQGAAFLPLAFQTLKSVGPMNNKLLFFHYQTGYICVLNKTQTQPPKETIPYSDSLMRIYMKQIIVWNSRHIPNDKTLNTKWGTLCFLKLHPYVPPTISV